MVTDIQVFDKVYYKVKAGLLDMLHHFHLP